MKPTPTAQTGLVCLSLVARHHGINLPSEKMRHDYVVGAAQAIGAAGADRQGRRNARTRQRSQSGGGSFRWAAPFPYSFSCATATGSWARPRGGKAAATRP